ncbi:MAG: TraX family protein [Cyanobacteria bacterium J069]|nr:MAG: TraX family protein [Cyanobacteria bacterium J069]
MVIDHLGYVFLRETDLGLLCYSLGRLSFPLFAWLLVQGEAHTQNFQQYALRLLGMAILSQPIYQLTFGIDLGEDFNILFTLLLGLLCLRGARLWPGWAVLIWIGGAVVAELANFNYDAYGIAMIALVGQYKPTLLWWSTWSVFAALTALVLPDSMQFLAGGAALIFALANCERGPKARWFYWFYPAHIAIIGLVAAWMNRLPT